MLPEFLFPVGNSMQDISRDDFSILNGNTSVEKDSNCSTILHANGGPNYTSTPTASATTTTYSPTPTPTPTNLGTDALRTNSALQPHLRSNTHENASPYDNASIISSIKLEDHAATDLFPTHASTWQQHPMNSHEHAHHRHHHHQYRLMNVAGCNKLLLQGSDDPFISRGANSVPDDESPAEFNSLIEAAVVKEQQQFQSRAIPQQQPRPIAQQLPRQQSQPAAPPRTTSTCSSLTKQQLKIKANLMSQSNQQQTQNQATSAPALPKLRAPKTKKKPTAVKLRFHHQALPPEYLSHYEATQTQVPKKEIGSARLTPATKLPPPKSAHENVRSWLQKIAEIQRISQQQQPLTHDANNNKTVTVSATSEVLPKKDVTVVSATLDMKAKPDVPATQTKRVIKYSDLPYMGEITLDHSKPRRGRKPKKADICHLIYKNYGTILPGTPKNKLDKPITAIIATKEAIKSEQLNSHLEEPLNLCLRDQAEDTYSISSNDDDEDEQEDFLCCGTSNCTTPLASAADVATDSLLAANLSLAMPGALLEEQPTVLAMPKEEPRATPSNNTQAVWQDAAPPNNENAMLHPMSLYYQKLIESGTLVTPHGLSALGFPVETIQRNNQLALKIPIPSGIFLTPKQEKSSPAACPTNQLDYPEPMSTPSSIKSENSATTNASSINHTLQQQTQQPPPKRKRSAIFIPPMPAENANNPSNEVSICKFKFTGGARPTLQEKKMLSVDAGGNYRYYSGTGDKSMRGYEFYPRESLQQTGGVLTVGGEKLSLDIPPPSAGLSNELLQIPDSPTANLLLLPAATGQETTNRSVSISPLAISPNPLTTSSTSSSNGLPTTERKKKTRRSAQREKLEKTFKEKGFLIQTQQLESAEGATYCKFRQLKKFTRYLFRNWKDYLPDELQQANEAAAAAAAAAALKNHQQQSLLTNGHESLITTGSQHTEASIESILACHGFGDTQAHLLHQHQAANARMAVETSLE